LEWLPPGGHVPHGRLQAAGNQCTLTFLARRATGAGYAGMSRIHQVEGSAGLANPASWQPVNGYTDLIGADQTSAIVGDGQTVIMTLSDAQSNKFHHLKVLVVPE